MAGQRFGLKLAANFGGKFWPQILVANLGRKFWPQIFAANFANIFGPQALAANFVRNLWLQNNTGPEAQNAVEQAIRK